MKTVRLTMAQALVRFLENQYIEVDGVQSRFVRGMFIIPGHGNVERIGKKLLMERQHKSVLSTNIDFYSGFVYEMLGLPMELYTPLFAVARIAGWSAHRMEELSVGGKLIRPRYECVEEHRSYTPMENR